MEETFADGLTAIVAAKRSERVERQKIANKWHDHAEVLLNRGVELFKERCRREAENQRSQLTVSFEVLTREVEGFPSHTVEDLTYIVDGWGGVGSPECWFYATRGLSLSWSPGAPVLFAEVLESLMPKFIEKIRKLGFTTCGREAGTWKVSVTWPAPQPEESEEKAPKKSKKDRDRHRHRDSDP
eukprot:TRINITY_DN15777_c0_g1_i1.p1 TRINITY_DN15777_c0_g1~~TRINITY_DN15777_c0_g1_i1.p1  ORF type:complete len:184 (+),score=29.48 TRINITY_DN15777_c0_g1_i1:98-649(+)